MRFGTTKSEMKLPFVSTLTFRYLCHYEDKIRFGTAKPETRFPFASALIFYYLCIICKLNKPCWINRYKPRCFV